MRTYYSTNSAPQRDRKTLPYLPYTSRGLELFENRNSATADSEISALFVCDELKAEISTYAAEEIGGEPWKKYKKSDLVSLVSRVRRSRLMIVTSTGADVPKTSASLANCSNLDIHKDSSQLANTNTSSPAKPARNNNNNNKNNKGARNSASSVPDEEEDGSDDSNGHGSDDDCLSRVKRVRHNPRPDRGRKLPARLQCT